MQKVIYTLAVLLFLTGCQAKQIETAVPSAAPEPTTEPSAATEMVINAADYEAYQMLMDKADPGSCYTAGVKRTYDMRYEDGSISVYDLDGVIQEAAGKIHITQHLNADGLQSEVEGWYDGSRLYMTYNKVDYYEDMDADSVRGIMLTELKPYKVEASQAAAMEKQEQDSITVYTFRLKDDAAKAVFDARYDIYGLNAYDDYTVTSGRIIQKFDADVLQSETAVFESTVRVKGIGVSITSETSVGWMNRNSTDVTISDEMKEEFAAFVNYRDIDTNAISDADITEDLAEATAVETLKKRLVGRLNYKLQEDGTYLAEFNDGESYRVDFENSLFIYSNRSSHYVYNWKGNEGGFGNTCVLDFNTGSHTSDCDESVIEQITNVRNYFMMELYYCGLSIDDLTAEQ